MKNNEKLDEKIKFKDAKYVEVNELYKCVMIEGYKSVFTLYNNLDEEGKELYKEDYDELKKILEQNDSKKRVIKAYCESVDNIIKVNAPRAILLDKLISFYKKVCNILNIKDEEK